MQFLSSAQSLEWLNQRCPSALALDRSPAADMSRVYVEHFPAYVLRTIARRAVRWLCSRHNSKGIVLIRDFGVSPSREDGFLYSLIRRHHLNTQTVWETPGHLFESHEQQDIESVIFLALCFSWGFVCAVDGGACLLTADNDSHVRFLSMEPSDLVDVKLWMADMSRDADQSPSSGPRS